MTASLRWGADNTPGRSMPPGPSGIPTWGRRRDSTAGGQADVSSRQRAATTNVLFVVPSVSREQQVREEIAAVISGAASESCRFWTTTAERLQKEGPLGTIGRST